MTRASSSDSTRCRKFTPTGDTARAITSVDAPTTVTLDTLSIKGAEPVTIEAYDVDTTANDTSTAAVLAMFRPDRFISSQTFTRAQLTDTLKYFISDDTVLAKIQNRTALRIGLRATGPGSSQMRIISTEGGFGPVLSFRATPDTATARVTVTPFSKTPVGESIRAADETARARAEAARGAAECACCGRTSRTTGLRSIQHSG